MKALVICFVMLFSSLPLAGAPAEAPFQVGEVLEMRRWPGAQPERVQVIRIDSYGVLIKWLDVVGQSYMPVEKLSRPKASSAPAAPAAPVPSQAGQTRAEPATAASPSKQVPGGPLMTQQEILGFLSARIGSDPWRHPKKAEVVAELAALIRRRGVDFRYQSSSDFGTKLINSGGNESTIPFAIQDNFGPPNTLEWLHGTWDMVKIAPTVDYVKGGWIYRRGEVGATSGSLVIRSGGTYDWNGITGRYRPATEDETAISYRGGGSVVLLAAKTGYDWIVLKDRKPDTGDWITVQEYRSRGTLQEYGSRKGRR